MLIATVLIDVHVVIIIIYIYSYVASYRNVGIYNIIAKQVVC